MQGLFRKKIHYYHGRFGFLPELKSYYRWLPIWRSNINKDSPKEASEAGRLRALLHLFYYGFEYFAAWPWVLLAKKRGHMLLFDRYFYNFGTQPSYREFPRSLITILLKIIPHPDLVILLKAHPGQIIRRKAELEPIEIQEQFDSLQEKWLSRISQVATVDNEQPLTMVLNEVRREVVRVLL
jgi:thymidylate kinase